MRPNLVTINTKPYEACRVKSALLVKDIPSGGHIRLEEEVIKDVDEGEDLIERHGRVYGAEQLDVLGEETDVEQNPERHRRLQPE